CSGLLCIADRSAAQPLIWSPHRAAGTDQSRSLESLATAPAKEAGAQALLIRNPDTAGGAPKFALADEYGQVQRFVEPSPGIELASYVGQKVRMRHDSGETLLASQLELPVSRADRFAVSQAQYVIGPRVVNGGTAVMPPVMGGMAGGPAVCPVVIDDHGYHECNPGTYALAVQPECAINCCVHPGAHRHSVFGTFLFLHPTGADMHHAQQQNGTGGAGTTPFGVIGVADPHHEPGFRVGASLALSPCNSLALSYTFFESNATDSVALPTSVGGGLGAVGSLVHHPNAVITSSAGPVSANYSIDMQLGDIEYRHQLARTKCTWFDFGVGIRYGRLEQDFSQTGVFGGSQGGAINTTTGIDYDGVGLRLGLDGERLLGQSRFSVYGKSSYSALFGEFHGNYRMRNATSVTDLAIVRWQDDRIAPMLEYELGLAWTSCNGNWRAAIGYTVIHWFNLVSTPEFVDAVQADNYVNLGDTLTFDGLTSTVEWRF
ncbi:MAG: Lpg1974 family pore-forming outer membrane protein, partial [Bythopirellula sp.]